MKQENNITAARVEILNQRAFASITTAIAAALIIAYILKNQIPSTVLLIWLSFMLVIGMIRYWLLYDYNKNKQNISQHNKYENRFIFATGLVGISWAFIIYSGLNLPVFEYRMYSLLLLVAIVAISVPIFSSSIKTIYIYIAPSLIVSLPLLLMRGGNDTALGFALIVFTAMVIRASKDIYNTLNDTLTLRFQTQQQAESLKQLQREKSSSEQRMQGILDYAPAAIYVKDLDGHFTFLNKKVADLHQKPHEEIIGKTLYDLLPKNIAEAIHQNDLEVINTEKTIEAEEISPSKDGLRHYISIKFPLFDDEGKISEIGGVSTDITERFNAEESLRILQQRLLLHREQSPLGIIEWNTDFEFLDWNPAAEKIFGFSRDEVQGQHITQKILPESARPAVNKIWAELLANKGGTYSLNENTTKDGRTILCEWHNTPLIDHDGNVIGVTSLVDDVTDREKNEGMLRQSQKMDAIGQLTGGIAHDFNNMLGVILGFSELIHERMPDENPKLAKYNNQIIAAANNAQKLTSKLLEFSRNTPSSNEKIDLNKLLSDMQHMLTKTLTARINLVMEQNENLWPIFLDKARMEDAILNMSINAMHAMQDGGTFTLKTTNTHLTDKDIYNLNINAGDYVLLTLSDTGIGMAPETKAKIFDPFFTTKGTEGTGLGLSQVFGFLQQSECAIQVSSELGTGTQIEIYIPRHEGTNTHAGKEKQIVNEEVQLPSGYETILVVDDEEALLVLAEDLLTTQGYSVHCAENAEQALKILENKSIDLLLSDVIMPGMDGYQLAAEVEKLYPKIKIQIVSGFTDKNSENLINNSLHEKRLYKPYTAEKLLKSVRKILDE